MGDSNTNSHDERFCPNCGTNVGTDSQFCSKCGTAQDKMSPQEPADDIDQQWLDFFRNMTKRAKVWLGVGAVAFVSLFIIAESWPTGLNDVSAVVTDCGFGDYGGATVEIRNNTNESKLVQVSVGWFDSGGRQLESGLAQETVPAGTTANGRTILGPGVPYESCRVTKVLGL